MIDLRAEAGRRDTLLRKRLDALVPMLMRRNDIACWIVTGREYAEDPVLRTMLPGTWLSGRRRTILVWFDDGATHERFAVSRYPVGDAFPSAWDPDTEPDQWARLGSLIAEHDPATIAVSSSAAFALADGLTASERDGMISGLPHQFHDRLVSGENLAVGWLETRLDEERPVMEEACATAHTIIRRGLSSEAIVPGATTTEDLVWWYRQTVHQMGLTAWFHPTVAVQRRGGAARGSYANRPDEVVISPGDFVHVDFGITWQGLCTDQQEHLYVLGDGETTPPAGLVSGMAAGNQMQDLLTSQFAVGRTGNEILAAARAAAEAESIDTLVYTHAIGTHGHAAGLTIGMWDKQDGVPGMGDYPLFPNTAYSIELSVNVAVPEWDDQPVNIMLEQDAWFDGAAVEYLDGRQTDLWVL